MSIGKFVSWMAGSDMYLFPLPHGEKAPRVRWTKVAATGSTAMEVLTSTNSGALNYGVACGPSKLVVIDLDRKKGKDGIAALAALEARYGSLPETVTVETPSGGRHLYFEMPDDGRRYPNSTDMLGEGIDTRGDGGYVVGPGSCTAQGEYRLTRGGDIAELPAWLADKIAAPERKLGEADPAPSIDAVRDLVVKMPNEDVPYDRWKQIGGAIANACGEDPEWRDIFADWSRKWPHHDEHGLECAFGQIERSPFSLGWKALVSMAPREARPAPDTAPLRDRFDAYRAEHYSNVIPLPTGMDALRALAARQAPAENEHAPKARMSWLADAEIEDVDWLIDGVIEKGELAVMSADSGVGKTFLAMDMALSVATGEKFADAEIKHPGAVLYMAGEGQRGLSRRAGAWAKARGVDYKRPPAYAPTCRAAPFGIMGATDIMSEAGWQSLIDMCEAVVSETGQSLELLVVDTLARTFLSGDENSAKDMGRFIEALDAVRHVYGCAVLVIHHTAKGSPGTSRGSGALRGAVNTEMMVTAEEGFLRLRCSKQKEAEEFAPLCFQLDQHEVAENVMGAAVTYVAWDGETAVKFASGVGEECRALMEKCGDIASGDPSKPIPGNLLDEVDRKKEMINAAVRLKLLDRVGGATYKLGRHYGLFATYHNLPVSDTMKKQGKDAHISWPDTIRQKLAELASRGTRK